MRNGILEIVGMLIATIGTVGGVLFRLPSSIIIYSLLAGMVISYLGGVFEGGEPQRDTNVLEPNEDEGYEVATIGDRRTPRKQVSSPFRYYENADFYAFFFI